NDVEKLISTGDWLGEGAGNFQEDFLDPFQFTAYFHGLCAAALGATANNLATAVRLAKECVVWICKNAVASLGGGGDPGPVPIGTKPGLEGAETGNESPVKLASAISAIVADTIALVSAVAGPEAELVDIGLAATGTGGGLVAELEVAPDIYFGQGSDATAVIDLAWSALGRLDRHINETDREIQEGLDKDLGRKGAFSREAGKLRTRPVQAAAYGHLRGSGEHTPGVTDDIFVVHIVKLYYAGFVVMPAAARAYDVGANTCTAARITGLSKQFPRSVATFNEAAELLGSRMSHTRDTIVDSGQAMVTAAKNYEHVDAYNAKRIRQLESQIPSPDNPYGYQYYTPPSWLHP
ncbi:MAG: hypothetical protein J2P17_35580, partial [Mycobacterium sp.]|nr:hypothetical protein [Mycobacterium sp.]